MTSVVVEYVLHSTRKKWFEKTSNSQVRILEKLDYCCSSLCSTLPHLALASDGNSRSWRCGVSPKAERTPIVPFQARTELRSHSYAQRLRPHCFSFLFRRSSFHCRMLVARKYTPRGGLLRSSPSVGHKTAAADACSLGPKSFGTAALPRTSLGKLFQELDGFMY